MVSAATDLKQEAVQIANDIKRNALALEPERLELEVRVRAINAISDNASLSIERARNFIPLVEGDRQCPSCWVRNEQKSGLRPVNSPDNHRDIFVCNTCGFEFSAEP